MKNQIPFKSISRFIQAQEPDDALVERKQSVGIDISPDDERTVTCLISTPAVDGDGEVVMPMGVDTAVFETNPIICWSHSYSQPPIGKCVSIEKTPQGIYAKIKFATTEMANEIWTLVQGGFLKANSIGFITKRAFQKGTKEFVDVFKTAGMAVPENCKRVISQCLLLENSICSIPSNKEALVFGISSKSMKVSSKIARELGLIETDIESDLQKDLAEMKVAQEQFQKNCMEFLKSLAAKSAEVAPIVAAESAKVEPVVVGEVVAGTEVLPAPAVVPVKPEPEAPRLWNIIRSGPAKMSAEELAELKGRRKSGKC